MYAVLSVQKTVEVDMYGSSHEVPLIFSDGMIGALPVFASMEAAEAYAEGQYQVIELFVAPKMAVG